MTRTTAWVLTGGLILALTGCTAVPSAEQQHRAPVETQLQSLSKGLQAGTWSKVEHFFSPNYQEGYGELRDRLEASFRTQQLIDLQFTVNRVLQADGLVNAQVRWNKSWVSKTGVPGKSTGLSEFTLQPQGSSYRIIRISGDKLF